MNLRELRTERALTIRELAEAAGVHFKTVSAIERGVELPSLRTGRKLAEALKVQPMEIEEVAAAAVRTRERYGRSQLLETKTPPASKD